MVSPQSPRSVLITDLAWGRGNHRGGAVALTGIWRFTATPLQPSGSYPSQFFGFPERVIIEGGDVVDRAVVAPTAPASSNRGAQWPNRQTFDRGATG